MPITVVNIRDFLRLDGKEKPKFKQYVYVGRANKAKGLKAHPLANPFPLPKRATREQRKECLEKYSFWLQTLPERFFLLGQLKAECDKSGLPLACWCGNWPEEGEVLCHVVILANILNDMES